MITFCQIREIKSQGSSVLQSSQTTAHTGIHTEVDREGGGGGGTIGYNVISSTGLRREDRRNIVSSFGSNQEFHSDKPKKYYRDKLRECVGSSC